jgi:hypothetical protein
MKAGFAAPALIAFSLLAGCGTDSSPTAAPLSSSDAREGAPPDLASPAPPEADASEAAVLLIKAARYAPRDDCSAQPGWPAFRAQLEAAVVQRNAGALAALTDPDVQLDYGGGHGIGEMKRRLDDKDYKLWHQIAALLPLGCGFDKGQAFLPWVFWNVPDDADPYAAMLALGPDVPAYVKASAASPVVGRLDWALVSIAEGSSPDGAYAKVTLPGGGTAFVERSKLRSVIDYRLIAEHGKQGWRITALIAGD